MELAGRVAIITGGGTGIGRATSIRLAKAGAKAVVVNYSRSANEADSTVDEIKAIGAEALSHRADVADEAQVKAMVGQALERYGRLDVLVNNAGTTRFIPHPDLDALTDDVWNEILGVNLKGTFFCCRAAAPAAEERSLEVHAEDLVPDVVCQCVEVRVWDETSRAGVVDQDVEPSVALERLADHGLHLRFVRHVGAMRKSFGADRLDLVDRRIGLVRGPRVIDDDRFGAGFRQTDRRRPAYAGAATGDDRNTSGQLHGSRA